jgi:hypothetical protein
MATDYSSTIERDTRPIQHGGASENVRLVKEAGPKDHAPCDTIYRKDQKGKPMETESR